MFHPQGVCPVADITMRAKRLESRGTWKRSSTHSHLQTAKQKLCQVGAGQVGSALAVRNISLQATYCASKHAIVGFLDSPGCELYHDKSKVKAIVAQMPAKNTPQFTWVKGGFPNCHRRCLQFYKPEVSARVILHAALTSSPRPEDWAGGSTVKAIVDQRLIADLLDFYLGNTGYKSQQRKKADTPDRPNKVWRPVSATLGAHGPLDKHSRQFILEAEVSKHRGWFVFGCGLWCAALCARRLLAHSALRRFPSNPL
jgi:hypothetical protein